MKKVLALLLALALSTTAWAGPASQALSSPLRNPVFSPMGGGGNPNLVLSWDAIHGTSLTVGNGALSVTRATTGTARDSSSVWRTFPINTPRTSTYYGKPELMIGSGKTNWLLNSDTPVTQTTASLATGTWCLWVEGTGSCTVSAGTATISGGGSASVGSPRVFTISSAGTVTCTVSGTLTRFQLENSPVPSQYIATGATTVAVAADAATIPQAAIRGGFPPGAGAVVVKWRPQFSQADAASNVNILGVTNGTSLLLYNRGGPNFYSWDGTTGATSSSVSAVNGSLYYIAIRWNNSGTLINGLASGKFQVGYSTDGATWSWGTAANYDGAFTTTGGNIYLGYSPPYPFSIGFVKFYNTVPSPSELTRAISDERAQVMPEFVPSILTEFKRLWQRLNAADDYYWKEASSG